MAEAPEAPAKGGSPLGVLTRKIGPLPGWAWVGLVVVGFFLYRRLHPSSGSSSSTGSTGDAPTDQTTYVPGFDAAGAAGGGGIGATSVPGTVNNYYYGDTAAGQAAGGGTNPGPTQPPGTGGNPHGFGPGGPVTGLPVVAPNRVTQPFGAVPPPYVPRLGAFVAS